MARTVRFAVDGVCGIHLTEEPEYRLEDSVGSVPPSRSHRLRSVHASLAVRGRASLSDLVLDYGSRYRDAASCPIWQMYWHLEKMPGGVGETIRRYGSFRLSIPSVKPERTPVSDGVLDAASEAVLEKMLAENPHLIERGMTLVQRQYRTGKVGTIDLLCRDRAQTLVVVELKKPKASDRSVVAQTSAYMSWVRENMAHGGQVRGIIIMGDASPAVEYGARAVPMLTVLFWSRVPR